MVSYNVQKMDKAVEEQRKALREAEKKREEQIKSIHAIIGEKIVDDLGIDCTQFSNKKEIIESAELIVEAIEINPFASEETEEESHQDNHEQSDQPIHN